MSPGYFFLTDTDGPRRSRVNEARSADEKELLMSTVSTVYFILGTLRTDKVIFSYINCLEFTFSIIM